MTGKASIIVNAYNEPSFTRSCLESIYAKTEYSDFEVLLVNNTSCEDTSRILNEFAASYPNACLIHNENIEGIASGYNAGAVQASGVYMVFLECNIVVTKGWLSGLIRHLQDPTVGLVGPVTNASGNEPHIQVDYRDLGDMDSFAESYTRDHEGKVLTTRSLDFYCVATKRSTYDEIGQLDEQFATEIVTGDDYTRRLREAGYTCICAEDVFVHHWDYTTLSMAELVRYWINFQTDRDKFESKWDQVIRPHRHRDALINDQIAQAIQEQIQLAPLTLERDRSIARLKREVARHEEEIARLRLILNDINTSTSWRMLQVIWAFRLRLAPKNSSRERVLLWAIERLRGMARVIVNIMKAMERIRLKMILLRNLYAKQIVVIIPTISWGNPLFQRPHQLALALARQGNLVIFCEPPYSEHFDSGIYKIADRLYVIVKETFEVLKAIPSPIVFTLVYNKKYLANTSNPRVVYEYIDELSVFPGSLEELQRDHQELVYSADVVVATASTLYQELLEVRQDTLFCPNGVDYDFIRKTIAEAEEPPEELLEPLQQGKPVIGYYGALAEWFDYELLIQAAKARPDYQFFLIGPDYDGSVEDSGIETQTNVKWLGIKPYTELPRYLKCFDVATVPFVLNEITHSTSPLKLFEYMAGGKPIVTTAMQECTKYPVVLIAHDAQEYVSQLDKALALRNDPEYLEKLDQTARENTWEIRARQITDAFPPVNGKKDQGAS